MMRERLTPPLNSLTPPVAPNAKRSASPAPSPKRLMRVVPFLPAPVNTTSSKRRCAPSVDRRRKT